MALLPWATRARAQSPAQEAGYLYLSPAPGASYVSEQTRYILVRFDRVSPSQVTNLMTGFVTVIGETSGVHSGSTRVATDGKTVIFTMASGFATNELVTVSLNPLVVEGAEDAAQPFDYAFMVTAPSQGSLPGARTAMHSMVPGESSVEEGSSGVPGPRRQFKKDTSKGPVIMPNGVSVPSDFPTVTITVNTNPSPGDLFLENGLNGVPPYTMILDNDGNPVWYRRGRMYDFKIQKNGMITWCIQDAAGFPAFDQDFNYLRTYSTTNGYLTDGHELKVLSDGSYYMIGYRVNTVDLSQYVNGGTKAASVRETVLQGFTPADELVFQWRAWDNYDIRDQAPNTDFPHMNAIDIDEDGNVLVSARHLSEVTKINRDSGQIMWRLSGAHNGFKFVNDSFNGTSYQHNISALGHGHYMVFDNGDYHSPAVSRAAEYQLDLTNMTATLAWQFRDTPDKYAYWLGNAQRLPSGNTLINFVRPQYPKALEVDTNGVKHFELSLTPGSDAYRAFRFPWKGVVSVPYLVVETQPDEVTLIFNKFGDTDVNYYRIYWGTSPHPTNLLATSSATLLRLSNLENGQYYFRVTAVDGEGAESDYSNEENAIINTSKAGENMVLNGDFTHGTNSWFFSVLDNASAAWNVEDGTSSVAVTSGGPLLSDVQLRQPGMRLLQGREYVLQFDAWSDSPHYIEALLGQNRSPWTTYTIEAPFLTPDRQRFRYTFVMQNATDLNSRLVFNMGGAAGDARFDDVSLFMLAPGDFDQNRQVDLGDLLVLATQWLKQGNGLTGDLNGDGKVDFEDFAVFAQDWTSGN